MKKKTTQKNDTLFEVDITRNDGSGLHTDKARKKAKATKAKRQAKRAVQKARAKALEKTAKRLVREALSTKPPSPAQASKKNVDSASAKHPLAGKEKGTKQPAKEPKKDKDTAKKNHKGNATVDPQDSHREKDKYKQTASGSLRSIGDKAVNKGLAEKIEQVENAEINTDMRSNLRLRRAFERILRQRTGIRPHLKPPSEKLTRAVCAVIRQGNYPEVACRAFGIPSTTFRSWATAGFQDIAAGKASPYSVFVMAVDAADAQAEIQDISLIRKGIRDWQALAWLRERKSFQRWGAKSLQLQGDIHDQFAVKGGDDMAQLSPDETAMVLAALEEAGVAHLPGEQEHSGVSVDTDIANDKAPADEDGDEVEAEAEIDGE